MRSSSHSVSILDFQIEQGKQTEVRLDEKDEEIEYLSTVRRSTFRKQQLSFAKIR